MSEPIDWAGEAERLAKGETGTTPVQSVQPAPIDWVGETVRSVERERGDSARIGYIGAQQQDPDAYAKAQDLARRTGVPLQTAQSQAGILEPIARTNAIDFGKVARETPTTAGALADPARAPLIHDDIDNLQGWERSVRGLAGDFGIQSSPPGTINPIVRAVRGLGAGPFDFGTSAYGLGETAAKWGAELGGMAGLPTESLSALGDWFEARRQAGQQVANEVAGDQTGAGTIERGVVGGFRSLSANLPGLLMSVMSGSPAPALAAGGMMAGTQASTRALDKGLSAGQALTYGIEDAGLEVMLGAIPTLRLLGDLKAGSSFGRLLGGQLLTEIPTEAATTAGQGFNEWANLHPERTIGDYLQAQGPAQIETAISTAVQTLLTAGLAHGVTRAVSAKEEVQRKAAQADATAALVEGLNGLAKASKVLQRDAGTFEAFVDEAAQDGPVQDVYVSSQVLHQEGLADQLAALSLTAAQQLAQGMPLNIRIPVGEYAARVAGTDLAPQLVDHLRIDPDGFSRAEAREYIETYGETLKEEFERTMLDEAGDRNFKDGTARVTETIKAELDALGRFRADVNDIYSLLVGQWYGATAARLGMSPEELFGKYRLRTVLRDFGGGDVLQQFAGQNAQTADLMALGTAKKRIESGDDAEMVRQETGWFKGVDGKWRFEIDDSQASIKTDPPIQPGGDGQQAHWLLGDILDHPRLFTAYPALSDVRVVTAAGNGASYSEQLREITVPARGAWREGDGRLSQLLHEIQHAIQHDEGFAKGGSPDALAREYGQARARLHFLEQEPDYQVAAKQLDALWEQVFTQETMTPEQGVAREQELIVQYPSFAESRRLLDVLRRTSEDGFSAYKNLAGEVEARNTQARRGMTAEERRQIPVSKDLGGTADVLDADVIVVWNGQEMASAQRPGNAGELSRNPLQLPETIEVDGVQRPTRNSEGKPIHSTVEGVRNFWRWFGSSRVVDDQGRPLVVYHKTDAGEDFSVFRPWSHVGSLEQAEANAGYGSDGGGGVRVMPLYVRITAPMRVSDVGITPSSVMAETGNQREWSRMETASRQGGMDGYNERMRSAVNAYLDQQGIDGLVYANEFEGEGDSWVALRSQQFKSAIGNTGAFSPDNPNILHQRYADQSRDADYLAAVERGDMEVAQRMVDAAAQQAQYSATDYQMEHTAPNRKDLNLASVKESGIVPDDYWTHPEWYQTTKEEHEAFRAIRDALQRQEQDDDAEGITIYRAVPKSVKEGAIRNGDWITPSRNTAKNEGAGIPGGFRIIEQQVPLSHLWWDGNSIAEFGYDDGQGYVYRNTKNNRKLLDAVTYDDKGNVIPLSKRFNSKAAEVYYDQSRAFFDPATWTIALTEKADLSSFLHESGHFFLEAGVDLAAQLRAAHDAMGGNLAPGELEFLRDSQALMDWFGLHDLDHWQSLTFEERRSYHEQFARGFEAYLWEGKAPSIELGRAFQHFRGWLLQAYRKLVERIRPGAQSAAPGEIGQVLNVELTPEVRAVFDRMLATTDQIQMAERGRSMFPLFTSKEQAAALGVTIEDWDAYQRQGLAATQAAIEELQAKGLQDLQWIERARGRVLGKLKRQAGDRRAEVQMEARREVMSQPVYRALDFLTRKLTTDDMSPEQVAQQRHAEAMSQWRSTRKAVEPRVRLDAEHAAWEASVEGRVKYRSESSLTKARRRVFKREGRDIEEDLTARMAQWEAENPPPLKPGADRPKTDPKVLDPTRDSLFQAVAKLGGFKKADFLSEWGWDETDKPKSGVFGMPFWRREGGRSIDGMAEALAAAGYLKLDRHGKPDTAELEDLLGRELRGEIQYSMQYDPPMEGSGMIVANPLGLSAGRLDRASIMELTQMTATQDVLDRAIIEALDRHRVLKTGGLHPDLVADLFGFSSGHELALALADAAPIKAAVTARADALMLERYGDLATPDAIRRAADMAIHNAARARFVTEEANALAKATGGRRVLSAAVRQAAEAMIGRLRVRDVRPLQYSNGQFRAGQAAEKASRAGDLATAAAEKRNEVFQTEAARAAYQAVDEAEKGVRYLKRITRDDMKALRQRIGADYGDQIEALLERFDLRTVSNKASAKRATFNDWLAAQREAGFEPDIPDYLLQEAKRVPWKDLAVDEFRGLVDTVRQIEHLGRLKGRLLTAAEDRAYRAIRDEIADGIAAHAQGEPHPPRSPSTRLGKIKAGITSFIASHDKPAMLARLMDGWKDGGPVWEHFIRRANERGDWEATRLAKATEDLSAIMAPILKTNGLFGSGQFFPSIGRSLNRLERFSMALNTGNAGNLQRLLGGEGWTVEQVRPVLESLTSTEWAAVQAIWNYLDTYRPEIASKERRVYGREPKWVEPTPFQILAADGVTVDLTGGYYPIKYDPVASARAQSHAEAEQAAAQLRGAYTSATTHASFRKARVEAVKGRPLLYTLSGLYSGVNDVIHDLAWHEWLIDTNRLLRSQTIDQAMRGHYGPDVPSQFKQWAADIAEGTRGAQHGVDSFAGFVRHGVSAAGLGFNVMSAAVQPLGIVNSWKRIGLPWVTRGVGQYLAHPLRTTREAVAASPFLANRFRTQFRELAELRNQIEGQNPILDFSAKYAYLLMTTMQRTVDVPTWLGARAKAVAEGADDARAVSLADQAVIDSQGSGMTKDLSGIERGGPTAKLFTVFYSYMNTTLQLVRGGLKSARTPSQRGREAAEILILIGAQAALVAALKDALTPGDSGEWDDPDKIARRIGGESLSFAMGMFVGVREISEAAKIISGSMRDYTGPAGLRPLGDTLAMVKQVSQGEFDRAFWRAAINLVGDATGLPAAQANRTITGVQALAEGDTDNPAAILFGHQQQR